MTVGRTCVEHGSRAGESQFPPAAPVAGKVRAFCLFSADYLEMLFFFVNFPLIGFSSHATNDDFLIDETPTASNNEIGKEVR